MKYVRYATLIASAVALAVVGYGTLSNIVEVFGFSGGVQAVYEDSNVLLFGFYQAVGELGLNINFWAWNGPQVAVALLATLLVASLPSRS